MEIHPTALGVKTKSRIAFDVDGTLVKKTAEGDVPRYDILSILHYFTSNGHTVFVWSGGGVDYATTVCKRLGISTLVRVLPKQAGFNIDIAFDDYLVELAKVNIVV